MSSSQKPNGQRFRRETADRRGSDDCAGRAHDKTYQRFELEDQKGVSEASVSRNLEVSVRGQESKHSLSAKV